MIDPFAKFKQGNTRSTSLPTDITPFVMHNGVNIVPNELVDVESALSNSDIYSTVDRISTDVASAEVQIREPFYTLLNEHPNHLMSPFTLWTSVVASLCLSGNAFVTITRDNSGLPVELELIPSADVEMTLEDSAKDLTYHIHYYDERKDKDLKSADMLHFKMLTAGDAQNLYTGRSPLDALAAEIGIQNYSNKLTLATLKHAINPSYLLKIPQGKVDAEGKEQIRKSWEEQTTGNNLGRAVVLDQGLDLQTVSINADVGKFLSNVNVSRTDIAKAFGIPASVLNGTSDQQSSIMMERSVYASSLNKFVKPIESELKFKLGVDAKLDINNALDVDNQSLVTNLTKLTGNQPVMSPKQAQQTLINRGLFINKVDLDNLVATGNGQSAKGGDTQSDGTQKQDWCPYD